MAREVESSSVRRGGSGRLSAEEAARLPDRLLDAAGAVFLAQGYAQTTMDAIARAAGASTKTVYSRYRNKHEILAATVRRMMDEMVPRLIAEFDAGRGEREPRAVLTMIGLRLATLAVSEQALGMYRLVVSEVPRFPDLGRLYVEGGGRVVAVLAPLFDQWRETGRLAVPDRGEMAAGFFLDLAVATPRNRALIGAPLSRRALVAHVAAAVELFMRACGEAVTPAAPGDSITAPAGADQKAAPARRRRSGALRPQEP